MQLVFNIIIAQYDCAYIYPACLFPNSLDIFSQHLAIEWLGLAAVKAKDFMLTSLFLVSHNSGVQRRLVDA